MFCLDSLLVLCHSIDLAIRIHFQVRLTAGGVVVCVTAFIIAVQIAGFFPYLRFDSLLVELLLYHGTDLAVRMGVILVLQIRLTFGRGLAVLLRFFRSRMIFFFFPPPDLIFLPHLIRLCYGTDAILV